MIDGQFYACMAETEAGARCRKQAVDGSRCRLEAHRTAERSPFPEAVLVKFTIDQDVAEILEESLHEARRTRISQALLDQQHAESAEEVRRSPFSARRGKKTYDDGTQVFGSQGITGVSVKNLLEELDGFFAVSEETHVLRRSNGKPPVLVLVFKNETDEIGIYPEGMISNLVADSWTAHVWSNPNGVHTVNLVERKRIAPTANLRFDDGLWDASPIQ